MIHHGCERCHCGTKPIAYYDFEHVCSGNYCNDCGHAMAGLEDDEIEFSEQREAEEIEQVLRDDMVFCVVPGFKNRKWGVA